MNEGLVAELGLQLGGGGGASDTGEQGKVPVYKYTSSTVYYASIPAVQCTVPVYQCSSIVCYTSIPVQ